MNHSQPPNSYLLPHLRCSAPLPFGQNSVKSAYVRTPPTHPFINTAHPSPPPTRTSHMSASTQNTQPASDFRKPSPTRLPGQSKSNIRNNTAMSSTLTATLLISYRNKIQVYQPKHQTRPSQQTATLSPLYVSCHAAARCVPHAISTIHNTHPSNCLLVTCIYIGGCETEGNTDARHSGEPPRDTFRAPSSPHLSLSHECFTDRVQHPIS